MSDIVASPPIILVAKRKMLPSNADQSAVASQPTPVNPQVSSFSELNIGLAVITTAMIQDLAVTNANIGNLAVTNAKINDLNAAKITAGDIATARLSLYAAAGVNAGSTVIDATHISIVGKPITDLSLGSYGLVLATDIAAGHIKLTSYITASGKWYDVAGVSIDSSSGIIIYGSSTAFRTRATYGGVDQCYMGSDGTICAGGTPATVILGSSGIIINASQALLVKYLGTATGYMLVGSDGFGLEGYTGKNVILGAYGAGMIYLKGNIRGGTPNALLFSGAEYMVLPRVGAAPSSPAEGTMCVQSTNNRCKIYLQGSWRTVTTSIQAW